MNYFRNILLFLTILLTTTNSFGWTGKVASVINGDTMHVLHDKKEVQVCLYGVETPEESQPYGRKAKKIISALVAGKTIDVSIIDRNRSGCDAGLVTVGSKNMNRTLVETGYAWVDDQFCKQSFCGDWKGLELQAKSAKIGLWQDASPTPPWQWRRGNNILTGRTKRTKSKNPNLLGVGPN